MKLACHAHQVMQPISLQKSMPCSPSHATNITTKKIAICDETFSTTTKSCRKNSFFDGKSLSSTITCQILKHLWQQNKSAENAYYFCWKYDFFFFGGKYSRLTFYNRIKIFVANKLLYWTYWAYNPVLLGLGCNLLPYRLLFVSKLFWRLQKAVEKTSFFYGKSLSLTITCQILKHLWQQNKSAENAYNFCWKYDFFFLEGSIPALLFATE